jgi:YidC/Oxa1 family membrane protein insertase
MLADQSKGIITFTRQDADGLAIEKKFSLPAADAPEAPYVVNLEITFRNGTAKPLSRPGYFLSTGGAAPIHEKDLPTYTRYDWYRDGKMKSIDVNWFSAGQIPLIGIQTHPERADFSEAAASLAWAAVSSQYFCTIVTAGEGAQGNSVWARRFIEPHAGGGTIYGMQGALGLPGFEIPPGQSAVRKFQIYAGPKDLGALRKLRGDQEAVMNFGMFGFVSKFLLWAMNLLHGLLGSYAAAIIVLTLCIKTGLWPLQNKATESMKRMSLLSPKMTDLREKYKNDPTKMNEELMKLYREYGVNPFSGCLPMLIQIPIFFGFYSMLGSAIELRNSSFLWVHDLSQPDTIAHVAGFPINILPLFMAGTMVWQMVISPKSGDAAQQRMMILMPVIFVVFAYNYASALSLYWTTQNLFSIVQLYLTRNKPLPVLEKKSDIEKREAAAMKRKKKKRSLP